MDDEQGPGKGAAMHVVAFVALVVPLSFLWSELQIGPSFLLLAPFLLHAAAHAAKLGRARRGLALASLGLAAIVAGITAATAAAMTIAPPITSDGHPVMPIGQAIAGAFFGIGGGALGATLYAKRADDDRRLDLVLHGVFAVLLGVAIVRAARAY